MQLPHCFVIDDSDVIRKYARLIFESLDYRVSEAANPEVALERLKLDTPDLMLVDWRVPGADMHEFIAQVRKSPTNTRPFIIYVTTENDFADINLAMRFGADAFLLKPFNRHIVEMKLQEIRIAA
jgi:two-component system chemotaxis response regulator CheY